MCGICGIIGDPHLDSGHAEHTVRAMMARMVHRGPDDEGLFQSKHAVLGHRRLAIIDLEHGKQPMRSKDDRFILVFNGEIYNYLELRQKLIQRGVRFQTFSDTEVLLELLIHDREEAFKQLIGMFAFCFYDTQTQEWLMGRDHFGIKPFYYTVLDNQIVFASEIKALFCHPNIHPAISYKALGQYFTFQFCLFNQTLFQDIYKLEPGYYMRGTGGRIQESVRYWDADFTIDEYHTEEYFKDRLRGLLEDSARLQIRSDVPLGAYLSGGLDSSVIATLAADCLNTSIPVFTGKFREGPAYDESPYAHALATHIGAEIHEVVPTAQDFVQYLPKLIYILDEPAAGPGLFPQYMVSRLAKEHVTVVLGGQGGDEIFGGYARYLVAYLEQALKGAIFENQEEGKHVVTLDSIIPNLPLLKEYRPLMSQFWQDGLFEDMDRRYFRMLDRSPDIDKLLTGEISYHIDRDAIFADFQCLFNHPDTRSYINKMTHFDFKTLLPALLQVEDRVSMAVSLESRVPLLDPRIMDLIACIPPKLKFQGGKTKALFKNAVSSLLPSTILNRKDKMGFPVPLKEWMASGIVREFVNDILLSRNCLSRGLFRESSLRNLADTQGVSGRQLWGLVCIELWFQQFIDT